MVRSTPTGISAVIDAYGRVCCAPKLGLGRRGVVDSLVPAALPPTFYAKFGDSVFWTLTLVSTLLILISHFVQNGDNRRDNTPGLRN